MPTVPSDANDDGLIIFVNWAGLGCQFANRATVGPVEVRPGVILAVSWREPCFIPGMSGPP